jgi:hypothetical protein
VSDDLVFEPDSPDMERVMEELRTRFRTLFAYKLETIFEIAKEIKAFDDEYNTDPAIRRASWSVVWKQIVGINAAGASYHEKIHEAFSSPVLAGYENVWPAKTYTLYLIARAFEVHERTVYKALEGALEGKGTISPAMYGERKKPARAKPKTYRTNERTEEKPKDDEAQTELQFPDDDPLSDASIKAAITAAAKVEESDKCFLTLSHVIKEYGSEIEEAVLRQILTARVAYRHPHDAG